MKRPCNKCKHNAVCLLDQGLFPGVLFKATKRPATVDLNTDMSKTALACEKMCRNTREKFLAQFLQDCPILPPEMRQLVKVTYHWMGDGSGKVYMELVWPVFTMGRFSVGTKDVRELQVERGVPR